ncbi:MAG: GGDEF domain-containing response regulator [Longimicrobiaceae bacterium]
MASIATTKQQREEDEILIAEDDAVSRLVLGATLEALGHEVLAVEAGSEAWQAWQEQRFSLVISDWKMPDLDGLELCRRIRAVDRPEYTYLILLTGMTGKESFLEGMAAGADDFLSKPFDPDQLSARLRVAERIVVLQAELLASREAMRVQAMRDALTGLPNRRALMEAFHCELHRARRAGEPLALVMADLDHFKQINDTYGHPAGDAVLREAAVRLQHSLRPYDQIGRYGGEEFLMLVPKCSDEDAATVAERIRACLSDKPIPLPEEGIRVTASLGVAVWHPGEPCDADLLLRIADAALYRAKREGRDRVVVAGCSDGVRSAA